MHIFKLLPYYLENLELFAEVSMPLTTILLLSDTQPASETAITTACVVLYTACTVIAKLLVFLQ